MNTDNLLHTDKAEVRKAVLEKLGKTNADVLNDKKILRNWLQYQTHLPETPCDSILELFLIVNKFNIEKCKRKLTNYYCIRNEIPELYVDKNPKSEHMKATADTIYVIPLPKLTPTLSRITIIKLKDLDPEKFDPLNFFAHSYNILEVRIREDIILTDTLIYDMEGIQLGHLFKLRLGTIRKAALVLEKVFSTRLEGIHYINLANSMQILVSLVKTMLKEKMRKRLHVHKDLASLHKCLPREVLPKEYDGDHYTLDNLHDLWSKKLKENQQLFDHLDTLVTSQGNSTLQKNENTPINSKLQELCVD